MSEIDNIKLECFPTIYIYDLHNRSSKSINNHKVTPKT